MEALFYSFTIKTVHIIPLKSTILVEIPKAVNLPIQYIRENLFYRYGRFALKEESVRGRNFCGSFKLKFLAGMGYSIYIHPGGWTNFFHRKKYTKKSQKTRGKFLKPLRNTWKINCVNQTNMDYFPLNYPGSFITFHKTITWTNKIFNETSWKIV